MDKLTEQISIRLPWAEYQQLTGLAALNDASISEYVRTVVMDHLQQQRAHFKSMSRVFGSDGYSENTENTGGQP
jgi:hypothetical protein